MKTLGDKLFARALEYPSWSTEGMAYAQAAGYADGYNDNAALVILAFQEEMYSSRYESNRVDCMKRIIQEISEGVYDAAE